jgi:hypothetical protein
MHHYNTFSAKINALRHCGSRSERDFGTKIGGKLKGGLAETL